MSNIFMIDQSERTPQKDASKYSSYRQKRAQSKHVSTSNTNSKQLEQIEQNLKTNMRRRGISQSFIEVQPVSRPFEEPFQSIPTDQIATQKLIDKYSLKNIPIKEVAEEELLISNNSGVGQQTVKKEKPTTLGLKTPLLKKNGSFLQKQTPQQSHKNFNHLHDKTAKIEPQRPNTSFIQEQRKTLVKGIKPAGTVQPTAKVEKKLSDKKGIGLFNPISNKAASELVKQIPKLQQIQGDILKLVSGEKAAQITHHFSSILQLMKDPEYI